MVGEERHTSTRTGPITFRPPEKPHSRIGLAAGGVLGTHGATPLPGRAGLRLGAGGRQLGQPLFASHGAELRGDGAATR